MSEVTNEQAKPKEVKKKESDYQALFGAALVLVAVITYLFYVVVIRPVGGPFFENIGYDGLAAAFNGMAFVAFYYAIYLQRKELQLQREELRMTREELEKAALAQQGQEAVFREQLRIQQEQLQYTREDKEAKYFPMFDFSISGRGVSVRNLGATVEQSDVYIAGDGFDAYLNYDQRWANGKSVLLDLHDKNNTETQFYIHITYTMRNGKRLRETWRKGHDEFEFHDRVDLPIKAPDPS